MHAPALGLAAAFCVAASLSAQDYLGLLNRTDTSYTSRGSTTIPNQNPSQVFGRMDHETYESWGYDPANPGMHRITGMHAYLQDQVGTTPETYSFLIYTEDASAPNFPDVTAPLGSVGPLPTPASSATGAVAWSLVASFATPILAPSTADVFLAVGLPQPASGVWPADGMSCHALYYVTTASGVFDLPGASHPTAPPEEVGNGGWYVPNPPTGPIPPTYTVTARQWKIEPIVLGATGLAGAITNQTSAALSNTAPGTSSQSSGLYPDAQNPPLNAGRVDDIANRWFMTSAGAGTPVLFFMGLGGFGPEIPLNAMVPGSTGAVCLNMGFMSLLGFGLTSTTGEAYQVIAIPAPARSTIAGLAILHQAVGLNVATGGLDANGCTRQIL
ncbi:MAG: hypothetical protein Fur0037_09590 [Planctomycetota bacterium]